MQGAGFGLQHSLEAFVTEAKSGFKSLLAIGPGDIIGGLSSALVSIVYGVTFANLIFSGPLKPWSAYGLASTFTAMAICGAFMSLRSSLPFVIAGPDGATAAITASLVSALIAALEEAGPPDDLLAPTMIIIGLSTAATGLILWAMGALRASNAVRYIPYPVIGGFLAATGFLMINGGIRIVTDQAAGFLVHFEAYGAALGKLFAAISMALSIALVQRVWKSPYAVPVALLFGIIFGNVCLIFMDLSLAQAQEGGWFVHLPRTDGLANTWDIKDILMMPWGSLFGLTGDILGMVFVTAVTMLLNTNAIEHATRQEVDLGHELKSIGIANLLSAACGGYVGCTSLSRSTLNHSVGGVGRVSGLISALISGAVLLIGPGFVGHAPKFVLGGLMLFLGGGMLKKWLVDSLRLIPRQDYILLLVVALAILKWGFIAGVFAGVIIGCVTFAYGASQTDAIKFRFDGAEYGSLLDRRPDELAILFERRDEIQGFVLQSYLFFGSANRLYEQVKRLLSKRSACRFLVFDFTLVNGIDSSALHSFRQVKQFAMARGVRLALVNLPSSLREQFSDIVTETDIVGDSLDHTLEVCENDVIARRMLIADEDADHATWLADALGSSDLAARLATHLVRQDVQAGEIVAHQGDPADSMHFIFSGRLGIMVKPETGAGAQTRVRSLGSCTTVGEMGLLIGGRRSATVQAETDSILFRLEEEDFRSIKRGDPELSQALSSYLASVMAYRLRMTSNTVAILRR